MPTQVFETFNPNFKTTFQALADAPLNYTTSFKAKTKILYVLLKASEAITETVTVTFNCGNGASYDVVLDSVAIVAGTNYYYNFDGKDFMLRDVDELTITCTNNNVTGTVYVIVGAETKR